MAADLWVLIWNVIDELGEEQVQVKWCKGHATDKDVADGKATQFEKVCNDHADVFAVRGRELAEDTAPTHIERMAYGEAVDFYRYLIHFVSDWQDDTTGPAEKVFIEPTRCVPSSLPRPFSYRVESQLGWA